MRNPGWIDLQVNGCSGIDFSSPELTGDDFLRAAERVLESGTGCFLPTLITSPFGLYRRNLGVIRRAVVRHGLEREVPGVHLEGPFISADPGAAGAHNPDWVVPPGPEKVEALLDLEPGFVRLVTLGADAENAAGAVRLLRSRGVAVSVGHHLADSGEIAAAADGAALYCSVRQTGGQQFHAVAAIKHTSVGRNLRAVAECVNLHICVCRVTALMRLRRHQAAELHQSSLCQPQRPTAAVVQPRKIVVDLCKADRVLRQPRA